MVEDVNKKEDKSCCFTGQTLGTFMNFVVLKCILLTLYILDITSDIAVAYGDYVEGNEVFGYITLGFVFSPGIFFALYMFCDSLWRFAGQLACLKGFIWLLICPFLPLWPILRDLKSIVLGVKATILPNKRKAIIKQLNYPSRTYLLKFLEAFTEAAPQIVIRLLKNCINNPFPFAGFRTSEIVQLSFSLFTLSLNVISTHQKKVSTEQVINGELESVHKYSLTFIGQIFALCWWLTFILTRIQAIVLFTSNFHYWICLVIGIHVGFMFIIQTIAATKDTITKIFIYFFGAFVFIFAYVQFNLTSKIKVGGWLPYTIFTVLVFMENIVMLSCWFHKQNSMIQFYVKHPGNDSEIYDYQRTVNQTIQSFVSENLNNTESIRESVQHHSEKLLLVHYALFAISLLFMTLTFICPFTNRKVKKDSGNEEELEQFSSQN